MINYVSLSPPGDAAARYMWWTGRVRQPLNEWAVGECLMASAADEGQPVLSGHVGAN